MSEWVETTLGEISIGKGAYGIAASAVPFDESKYTYLRITDIRDDGTLDKSGLMSVDDPEAFRYVLKPGDLVIARTGASTGRNYFYDGRDGQLVYAGFLIKFSLDPQKVYPPFVKYHCLSQQYRDWIASFSNGSTRGNINAVILADLPITLPPLATQKRIAAVLSALDDKIELNNRINANLEAQAQALFRSWFVDFEPWGGTMPEGWREGTLEEICHYSKQRVPCEEATVDNYVSTESMKPDKQGIDTASSLPATGTVTVVEKGAVLVSNIRPYFKKIYKPEKPCLCSQDVLCFVPKRAGFEMLLFETLWDDAFFAFVMQGAKGTKMPRGDKEQIMQYRVSIPDGDTLERFNAVVSPMLAKSSHNRKENRTLAAIRDTLLPKLMSGEIDVSEVEVPA